MSSAVHDGATGQGPIETLRWTPAREDARAYLALRRELRGWRFWGLIGMAVLAGMTRALLEPVFPALASGWALLPMVAAAWLAWTAVLTLDTWRRVARWPLSAGEVELERWGDHLVLREDGQDRVIAVETIGNVTAGAGHVFIQMTPEDAVIVPLRAFGDAAEMAAFAAAVDAASQAAAD